jgi:hypothetical protein
VADVKTQWFTYYQHSSTDPKLVITANHFNKNVAKAVVHILNQDVEEPHFYIAKGCPPHGYKKGISFLGHMELMDKVNQYLKTGD